MAWWLVTGLVGCGRIGLGGVWCDIGHQAEKIAGADATDCADDWTCAADALAAGTPFYMGALESDGVAIDGGAMHLSVAFDGSRAFHLWQDGNGEVAGVECVSPSVGDSGRFPEGLECASTLPEGNHFRVCGHDGGQEPAPLPFPD